MRVIAGTYRSRTIAAPRGMETRPTGDRLRERLFNILGPRVRGARVADLFAGSGAVGIEALSRGAAHVLFAENAPTALEAIRANLTALGIRTGYRIAASSAAAALRKADTPAQAPFDLVFLDPPYELAAAYSETLTLLAQDADRLLAPDAIVIVEHRASRVRRTTEAPIAEARIAEKYAPLQRYRLVEQGEAALSFYRRQADEPAQSAAM